MEEREIMRQVLRVTPSKFDALTLSMEQYTDLDKISLDEVIGSLTVHELQLKERESREEEQTLLARALKEEAMAKVDILLLMKVKRTSINLKYNVITVRNMTISLTNVKLYLLKLNVIKQCLITKENETTSRGLAT
ncbi:unnamed protein product [Spirodela intermedia]|uniref:Uncharacterized protein n=1 Tax=Spirodela intermedia TaxID=51605 RepID=A0A7I8IKP2_SPIIN|nr:unnamed protein product [Spirodela intermedia]CAA6658084.1 unnamed protein product [Spirodela intermedia]